MNFKYKSILTIFFTFIALIAFSQEITSEESEYLLNNIEIKGNKRTQRFIIMQAVHLGIQDKVNKSDIEKIQEKLIDMSIFEEVIITINDLDGNEITFDSDSDFTDNNEPTYVNMVIYAKDKWTMIFVPKPGYDTFDGFELELKFKESNFLGLRKNLNWNLGYQNDRVNFDIAYSDPLFFNNPSLKFSYSFSTYSNILHSINTEREINWNYRYNYKEDYKKALSNIEKADKYWAANNTFTIGYTFRPIGLSLSLNTTIGYKFQYTYYDILLAEMLVEHKPSYKLGMSIGWSNVTRQYFTKQGTSASFSFSWDPPWEGNRGYPYLPKNHRYNFQWRARHFIRFIEMHNVRMQWRYFYVINNESSKGGDGNIRGVQGTDFKGLTGFIMNTEYFLPLSTASITGVFNPMDGKIYSFKRGAEFMFFLVFFHDWGWSLTFDRPEYAANISYELAMPDSSLFYSQFATNVGIGLRIYPKFLGISLRADFAINPISILKSNTVSSKFQIVIRFSEMF